MVDVDTLAIAIVMANDTDTSGQVDLAEVTLKNTSNVAVSSASLLKAVNYQSNINDSNVPDWLGFSA